MERPQTKVVELYLMCIYSVSTFTSRLLPGRVRCSLFPVMKSSYNANGDSDRNCALVRSGPSPSDLCTDPLSSKTLDLTLPGWTGVKTSISPCRFDSVNSETGERNVPHRKGLVATGWWDGRGRSLTVGVNTQFCPSVNRETGRGKVLH